jgi:hypothetical protein
VVRMLFNDDEYTIKLYFDDWTDRILHFTDAEYCAVKENIKNFLLNKEN